MGKKETYKFQVGNKVAEKWTEEEALKIANGLIKWLGDNPANMFFKEYLMYNGLYQELITYLCEKYETFFNLIKEAKEIQESKLVKYGVANKLNATMTIFVLKNHHNYKDKSEVENTNLNANIDISDDELKRRLDKFANKSTEERG